MIFLMIAKIFAWSVAILFSLSYVGKLVNKESIPSIHLGIQAGAIVTLITLYTIV